jgi:hypothetical protein
MSESCRPKAAYKRCTLTKQAAICCRPFWPGSEADLTNLTTSINPHHQRDLRQDGNTGNHATASGARAVWPHQCCGRHRLDNLLGFAYSPFEAKLAEALGRGLNSSGKPEPEWEENNDVSKKKRRADAEGHD